MMQEIASDFSQTMLNGVQGHKDVRPAGEFLSAAPVCIKYICQ